MPAHMHAISEVGAWQGGTGLHPGSSWFGQGWYCYSCSLLLVAMCAVLAVHVCALCHFGTPCVAGYPVDPVGSLSSTGRPLPSSAAQVHHDLH